MPEIDDKISRRRRGNTKDIEEKTKFKSFGGTLKVLDQNECEQIHKAVLYILSEIGLSEISQNTSEVASSAGALIKNGRLYFPKSMTEDAIASLAHPLILHGQEAKNDLPISGKEVYFGTGGATPQIVDFKTGEFRDSQLNDLYDNARLVEHLENVDF